MKRLALLGVALFAVAAHANDRGEDLRAITHVLNDFHDAARTATKNGTLDI